MSGSFLLIAVVMSVLAIAVVLAPLRGKQEHAPSARERPEPAQEYPDALLALRDLDFDHELGVVAGDDYLRLREELVARAAQSMPKKKPRRAASAEAVTAGGRKRATGNEKVAPSGEGGREECPDCGRPVRLDHMFCGKCGARLQAAQSAPMGGA